jgi:RNA recognition motif-containing protein
MDNATQDGASSATADGRRIYLGNLLYSVKPEDVDALLQEHGLSKYDKIHLSFDPISARNPGYCFVEFFHRDDANQALEALAGAELVGRPVKVGPCHAKAPSQRQAGGYARTREPREESSPTPRWGDWRGERQAAAPSPGREREPGQTDRHLHNAIKHHDEMATDGQGRRLFVGGLSKMINQEQHQEEVREYFAGFDV